MTNLLSKYPDRKEPWHDLRYERSLNELLQCGLSKESRVLNFGGSSTFNALLRDEVGCEVVDTDWDLRLPRFDQPRRYDFAIMMEVIEHLSDMPDPNKVADWTYSGALNCLRTALSCSDNLFLTTPNITSAYSVARIIEGKHPHMFQPHTHEYAPSELEEVVKKSGWRIVELKTVKVWNDHQLAPQKVQKFMRVLTMWGADKSLRGDCIFLKARR